MLKFLFILILTVYLFYRVASFLFRMVLGGQSGAYFHQNRPPRNKKDNINVDKTPRSKMKRGKGYNGGEYVDFEEIK